MFFGPVGVKQNLYQGSGSIRAIPKILEAESWKRVMIVADPGVEKAGLVKPFEKLLKDCGADYCLFTNIRPNPEQVTIEQEAIPMYREFKADVILAIGGGSALDSAKGIAIVGESGLSIKDAMAASPGVHAPMPHKTYPMIAVPTTCGTGSETTRNAVISDETGYKMVPMQDCILPQYAVCDPDLLATLPQSVASATAMDALVQAIECYVGLGANPMSEIYSLSAIELIGAAIRPYYANRAHPKWADKMSLGCMYGGIAWNLALPAQVHCSNHAITQHLHIPHGDACAILFPPFIEWNGIACKDKFKKVYELMFPDKDSSGFEPELLMTEIMRLNRDLNIMGGKTMKDFGATEAIIHKIMEPFSPKRPGYPRTTSKEDWTKIMIKVMNGEYMIP
jgi:alcohol dehydrogenase class IV